MEFSGLDFPQSFHFSLGTEYYREGLDKDEAPRTSGDQHPADQLLGLLPMFPPRKPQDLGSPAAICSLSPSVEGALARGWAPTSESAHVLGME